MAAFEITGGIDPLLAVTLEKGEAILAESNAMVAMDTALSLKGKTRGGLMGSIARKFMNDETFFQQRIEADDQAGTVLLAPPHGLDRPQVHERRDVLPAEDRGGRPGGHGAPRAASWARSPASS